MECIINNPGPLATVLIPWVLFLVSELLGLIPEKYIKSCGILDFIVNILKRTTVTVDTHTQAQQQLQVDLNEFNEYIKKSIEAASKRTESA